MSDTLAFRCGVFISYSHKNEKFVDRMYADLKEAKTNVWLDKHDLIAGPLPEQVSKAIRINDVVLLVLSEDSIESDWVKWELKRARRVKKESGRDILCPVALDDSWKAAADSDPDWGVVTNYNVLDFSDWEGDSYDTVFSKLIEGIKRYYANDPVTSIVE